MEEAKRLGATLIITVDCGITSFDAAACAKKEGIDVIITDHHEPVLRSSEFRVQSSELDEIQDFMLPEAIAVVNPKLQTHNSKTLHFIRRGLAFKIAQALEHIGSRVKGQGVKISNPRTLEPFFFFCSTLQQSAPWRMLFLSQVKTGFL